MRRQRRLARFPRSGPCCGSPPGASLVGGAAPAPGPPGRLGVSFLPAPGPHPRGRGRLPACCCRILCGPLPRLVFRPPPVFSAGLPVCSVVRCCLGHSSAFAGPCAHAPRPGEPHAGTASCRAQRPKFAPARGSGRPLSRGFCVPSVRAARHAPGPAARWASPSFIGGPKLPSNLPCVPLSVAPASRMPSGPSLPRLSFCVLRPRRPRQGGGFAVLDPRGSGDSAHRANHHTKEIITHEKPERHHPRHRPRRH